jgi:hypothetical protein
VQALSSDAAIQAADNAAADVTDDAAAVQPKIEAIRLPDTPEADTSSPPAAEPQSDHQLDEQLVATEPPQEHHAGKEPAGMVQATLPHIFEAPKQTTAHTAGSQSSPVPEDCCEAPGAEQNSDPNGQSISFACTGKPSESVQHADSHAATPEPSHAAKPGGQPQLPVAPQQFAPAAVPDTSAQDCAMATLPPCPPAVRSTPSALAAAPAVDAGLMHCCHASAATTNSPLLDPQSQIFTVTPLPPNCGQLVGAMPVQGPLPVSCDTTSHAKQHWAPTQQSSWACTNNRVRPQGNVTGQPPAKSQRLIQPGDGQRSVLASASASAPTLHPADAQLLESGFLDSDSGDDESLVPPSTGAVPSVAANGGMIERAVAQPQSYVRKGAVHPTPPAAQDQCQQAQKQSRTTGPGPPSVSPCCLTAVGSDSGAAQDDSRWAAWHGLLQTLSVHDTRLMIEFLQRRARIEQGAPVLDDVSHRIGARSLMLVMDEVCKNVEQISEWCSARLRTGDPFPLGVAMVIRHAEKASCCTEIHPDMDFLLASSNVIVADDVVKSVVGNQHMSRALFMVHAIYKSLLCS